MTRVLGVLGPLLQPSGTREAEDGDNVDLINASGQTDDIAHALSASAEGAAITDGDHLELVSFSFDNVQYETNLNPLEAATLRNQLSGYVAAARKNGTFGPRPSISVSPVALGVRTRNESGGSTAEQRAWARTNGYDVATRGPVPSHVRRAFIESRLGRST